MASVVGICRIALDLLGDYTITDLSDGSKQARLCDRNYPAMRDAVLRAHPWNCAITRTSLPALSTAPSFGWTYCYQLPADCLRLLPLTEDGEFGGPSIPHIVEGRKVLTDEPAPLKIRYIQRLTDSTVFDDLLVDAIASRLAWQIAYNLTGSRSMASDARQVYMDKISEAKRIDGLEGTIEPQEQSEWLDSRH